MTNPEEPATPRAELGLIVLYGDMSFPNQNRRNTVVTRLRSEATARGFTDWTVDGYAPGITAVGATRLQICLTHGDVAVVELAHAELNEYLKSQGSVDGAFDYINNAP